jgi:hypothetical protein
MGDERNFFTDHSSARRSEAQRARFVDACLATVAKIGVSYPASGVHGGGPVSLSEQTRLTINSRSQIRHHRHTKSPNQTQIRRLVIPHLVAAHRESAGPAKRPVHVGTGLRHECAVDWRATG